MKRFLMLVPGYLPFYFNACDMRTAAREVARLLNLRRKSVQAVQS